MDIENSLKKAIEECPAPSDDEIRKLLAIQGYLLNKLAMDYLSSTGSAKLMRQGVRLLQESRKSLTAAADIDLKKAKLQADVRITEERTKQKKLALLK